MNYDPTDGLPVCQTIMVPTGFLFFNPSVVILRRLRMHAFGTSPQFPGGRWG